MRPDGVAGAGTGVLNALLGREAIARVPPDRAAMGSGANNTARYLGAAFGITLFVTVATHAGDDLYEGWNAAVLVSAALTLLGAGRSRWPVAGPRPSRRPRRSARSRCLPRADVPGRPAPDLVVTALTAQLIAPAAPAQLVVPAAATDEVLTAAAEQHVIAGPPSIT